MDPLTIDELKLFVRELMDAIRRGCSVDPKNLASISQFVRAGVQVLRLEAETKAQHAQNTTSCVVYSRPAELTSWQNEVLDAMLAGDACILGSRRTGKTLLLALAAFEHLLSHPGERIAVLSGKEEQARLVLTALLDPAVYPSVQPFVANFTATRVELVNGSVIQTSAGTDASTRGMKLAALVADEAGIQKPDALAAMLPSGDTVDHFRWWVAGTPMTGGFFQEIALDPGRYGFELFKITDEMCTWLVGEQRSKTRTRLEALAGKQFAMQELDAVFVQGENIFTPSEVAGCFVLSEAHPDDWESALPRPDQYERVCAGFDPGWRHPFTGVLLGKRRGQYFEIDSFSYTAEPYAEDGVQKETNPVQMAQAHLLSWHGKWRCPIRGESNSGGLAVIEFLRGEGADAAPQNWGALDSNAENSKSVPLAFLKELMASPGTLNLRSGKLRQQLYGYKADKKNDDLVDALLHAAAQFNETEWLPYV